MVWLFNGTKRITLHPNHFSFSHFHGYNIDFFCSNCGKKWAWFQQNLNAHKCNWMKTKILESQLTSWRMIWTVRMTAIEAMMSKKPVPQFFTAQCTTPSREVICKRQIHCYVFVLGQIHLPLNKTLTEP